MQEVPMWHNRISTRIQVWSLARHSGLRGPTLLQLRHGLQLQLGSDPCPGNSMCWGGQLKRGKKKDSNCSSWGLWGGRGSTADPEQWVKGSGTATADSDSIPGLATSIYHGCSHLKQRLVCKFSRIFHLQAQRLWRLDHHLTITSPAPGADSLSPCTLFLSPHAPYAPARPNFPT